MRQSTKLMTSILFFTAAFAAINSYAKEIICPSLQVIHRNADMIDKFELDSLGGGYYAYASNKFYDGNLKWVLEVDFIDGSIASNQIIPYAKEAVRKINERTEYAEDMLGMHVCRYGSDIMAYSLDNRVPLRLRSKLKF